jgi:hypothetical protein
MTNRPKRPRDPDQLAKWIIDIATGQKPDRDPTPQELGKSAQLKRPCRIVWRKERRIGVTFE